MVDIASNTSLTLFFGAMIPAEGTRCLVVIQPDTKPIQLFFATDIDLATEALRWDHLLDGTRGAVYHGCATYRPGAGRKAKDVLHVQALWLDVDCGEGKPYVRGRAGAEAVVAFCAAAGLPIPLFVRSGTGLHCYWCLDRPLDPAEWKHLAKGLKVLCQTHGLEADHSRTTDVASILRPPGTTHRKGHPIRVVAGPIPQRVSPELFKPFTNATAPGAGTGQASGKSAPGP